MDAKRYHFHIVRIPFFVYVNLFKVFFNEIINLLKLVASVSYKANFLNSVRHLQISIPGHEIHAKFDQ